MLPRVGGAVEGGEEVGEGGERVGALEGVDREGVGEQLDEAGGGGGGDNRVGVEAEGEAGGVEDVLEEARQVDGELLL